MSGLVLQGGLFVAEHPFVGSPLAPKVMMRPKCATKPACCEFWGLLGRRYQPQRMKKDIFTKREAQGLQVYRATYYRYHTYIRRHIHI